MPEPIWRVAHVLNTDTNDKFAAELEKALNQLETSGYKPEPGLSFQNGNHVVIAGKRSKTRAKKR